MLPSLSLLTHSFSTNTKRKLPERCDDDKSTDPSQKREINVKQFISMVKDFTYDTVFAYAKSKKDGLLETETEMKISLRKDMQFGVFTSCGKSCVSVFLYPEEATIYVQSLFHKVGEDRKECQIITRTLSGSDSKSIDVQIGDLVLKVLDFIASENKLSIALDDVSKFQTNATFNVVPTVFMNDILSLSRGYGFYTKRGFVPIRLVNQLIPNRPHIGSLTLDDFDKVMTVSNLDLQWIHLCATSPICELQNNIEKFNEIYTKKTGITMNVDYSMSTAQEIKKEIEKKESKEFVSIFDLSMRQIFEMVNKPNATKVTDEFLEMAQNVIKLWPSLWDRSIESHTGDALYPGDELVKMFHHSTDGVVEMQVEQDAISNIPTFTKKNVYSDVTFWVTNESL